MTGNVPISGYLDVKISAKVRRGLTPWKAWRKQWCEIKKLDNIENGVELRFRSAPEGAVINCVVVPRSSVVYRTKSRSKQYAFGLFTVGRRQKPLLYLSGNSESNSQEWMTSVRKYLCVASHLPVGENNFYVSAIDNAHSREAGLVGLFGVLGTNSQEITVSDPCTADVKISWKWHQFHQFHLQASALPVDEKTICVMHTSIDFPSGPGQLLLYSQQAPKLLQHLITRGYSHRMSRSEGDLHDLSYVSSEDQDQTGSEDSGVRISITSDDSFTLKSKNAASLISIGMGLLAQTPGGSETDVESIQDLICLEEPKSTIPRIESGVSLASGVYEEISEAPICVDNVYMNSHMSHVYEDPDKIISVSKRKQDPPPLPPRSHDSPSLLRCNTLPAKDLSKISKTFMSESDYMIMSPSKSNKLKNLESLYVPMSPIANLKTKIENCYVIMSRKS